MRYEMKPNKLNILQVRYECGQLKSFGPYAQTNRKESLDSREGRFLGRISAPSTLSHERSQKVPL